MANIIILSGLPGSGKTTTSNKIRDYYDVNKIPYSIIRTDELHIEFIKKYYPYMVGEEMSKNLQYHFESLSNELRDKFYEYLIQTIDTNTRLSNVILEGRHLKYYIVELNNRYMKDNVLTNVYVSKEKVMIMKGMNAVRDMDVYKHILSLN